jgi:hypothetical protein
MTTTTTISSEEREQLRHLLRKLTDLAPAGSCATAVDEILDTLDALPTIPLLCDGCNAVLRTVPGCPPSQVERGLHVQLTGGYGMFFDDAAIQLTLCHNCSAHLISGLSPRIGDSLRGSHNGTSCCPFVIAT